ncbi:hypothetical protein PFISCL1PPCAC_21105, partial [Pristionchus fissidentatus]
NDLISEERCYSENYVCVVEVKLLKGRVTYRQGCEYDTRKENSDVICQKGEFDRENGVQLCHCNEDGCNTLDRFYEKPS